jgi:hypothetical protein
MVSEKMMREIQAALETGTFSVHDFEIKIDTPFTITYKYRPGIVFQISTKPGDKTKREISYKPGTVWANVTMDADDGYDVTGAIREWLYSILELLSLSPVERRIEEQRIKIEEILTSMKEFPNEYFSAEEAEDLKSKLDALEATLTESIRKNATDQKEMQAQLDKLRTEMETLKLTLGSLKKPKWYQSLGTRIGLWMSDPKNQQALLQGAVTLKKMLSKDDS